MKIRANLEEAVRNIFFGYEYTQEHYRRIYLTAKLLYPRILKDLKRYRCPFCGQQFLSRKAIKLHLRMSWDCAPRFNHVINFVIEVYRKYVDPIETRKRKGKTYYYVKKPHHCARFENLEQAIYYAVFEVGHILDDPRYDG